MVVPTKPFWGVIGVAPPRSMGRVPSGPPNVFGGNMDNHDLQPGTSLFLPVHAPGALISVGDGHAVQGKGEVGMSALETSLKGEIQVILHKGMRITWPRAETPTHYMTMGLDADLNQAAKIATREMLNFIVATKGLPRDDVLMLLSAAMDLHVTQIVDGTKGIHAMIPKAVSDSRAEFRPRTVRTVSGEANRPLRRQRQINRWPIWPLGCTMLAKTAPRTPREGTRPVTTSADLAQVRDWPAGAGRPVASRWSRWRRGRRRLLAAVLIVILCALVVPPFVFLLQGSVTIAGAEPVRLRMGLRQFRGGAARAQFPHHRAQLARLRGGERGARARGRLGDGLDRRAHQRAAQGARLSHRDHLARHALHSLCHGLAPVLRQGRAGQPSLPHADRLAPTS